MSKPYTWEEIQDFLNKELKKTRHIMVFGILGSENIESDIDTIITKRPKSKTSKFYREIHNLFDKLNKYLNKKYKSKVIRFSLNKPESLKLSNYSERDLAFHVMVYTSYSQIEKDWKWALSKDEKIKDILLSSKLLKGKIEEIFSISFKKENHFDNIFIFLYWYDKINSNYPEKFLVSVMNYYFDFLYRKKLKLKPPKAKNKKEVKKYFYKLCNLLDKKRR